jgi:hypothetical protein
LHETTIGLVSFADLLANLDQRYAVNGTGAEEQYCECAELVFSRRMPVLPHKNSFRGVAKKCECGSAATGFKSWIKFRVLLPFPLSPLS